MQADIPLEALTRIPLRRTVRKRPAAELSQKWQLIQRVFHFRAISTTLDDRFDLALGSGPSMYTRARPVEYRVLRLAAQAHRPQRNLRHSG